MGPTVGILSGYLAGSYEGPIISAVLRVVSAAGGRVVAIQTAGTGNDYHQGVTLKDLGHVGWRHIGGFVTVANAVPLNYLEALREAGKAVVAIGNEEPGLECPTVLADNPGGIAQAVEHLLGHGHTRIGFVGCLDQFDIRDRYEAYCSTLQSHGLEPDPRLMFRADNNFEHGGIAAGKALVAAGLPSTALVAATDLNAVAVMTELREAGFTLPTDQAIVGFDDIPDCALLSPSLSTVSQDFDGIGTLAAQLLLRQMSGEEVPPGRYVLPTSYVARESCGCVGGDEVRAGTTLDGEPVAVFLRSVGSTGPPGGPLGEAQDQEPAASLAAQLEQIYGDAAAREPTASDLLKLSQICQDLYDLNPSRPSYDAILSLAARLASGLVNGDGAPAPEAAERLGHCTTRVRLSLTKALLEVRNSSYYELRKSIRDEYNITLELLNDHDQDPRLLHWLKNTEAVAGVLALWRDEPLSGGDRRRPPRLANQRVLDIVGAFKAFGEKLQLTSYSPVVESFPPEELFEAAPEAGLVFLFPVKSLQKDWGFLAIAQPVGPRLEQEAYFTWSALFSEALDHKALLLSLSQRSDDLSRSYQREREMAQAVRESEERYALAALAANDGLWDWDLTSGTIYFSARWKQMFGFAGGDIGNDPEEWLGRVHPEDKPHLLEQLSALKTGERHSVLNEHRARADDGSYLWALCRGLAVPGDGRPATRIVGSLTDVTERRSLEERLRRQALYDSLTGLANRVLFNDRLTQAMANAKRKPGFAYTVLWLDLDNFKCLNDEFGHLFGDELLVQVAGRIRKHVRDTDTAARFGGDEFVVLLQDADSTVTSETVLNRLSEHLSEPYDVDGRTVSITTSIGMAIGTAGYDHPEDLLREADSAMYRVKTARRASYLKFGGQAPAGHAFARHGSDRSETTSVPVTPGPEGSFKLPSSRAT